MKIPLQPDMQDRLKAPGMRPLTMTVEQFEEKSEVEK